MKRLGVFLFLASGVWAANPDAPADITISSTVAVPAPDRYGTNIAVNGFADFNNGPSDPGFELSDSAKGIVNFSSEARH